MTLPVVRRKVSKVLLLFTIVLLDGLSEPLATLAVVSTKEPHCPLGFQGLSISLEVLVEHCT